MFFAFGEGLGCVCVVEVSKFLVYIVVVAGLHTLRMEY